VAQLVCNDTNKLALNRKPRNTSSLAHETLQDIVATHEHEVHQMLHETAHPASHGRNRISSDASDWKPTVLAVPKISRQAEETEVG
jgi:hypothetical protein